MNVLKSTAVLEILDFDLYLFNELSLLVIHCMYSSVLAKLYVDRGYISQTLRDMFFVDVIYLVS
jgi:hypothetical protein